MRKTVTSIMTIAVVWLCIISVLYAGQSAKRDSIGSVIKLDVPQMTVANGSSADDTADITINGSVKQITVGVNNNTGNKTATVSLTDADGSVLFTTETIAENTDSAPVVQQFMTVSDTDLPLNILCDGTITVTGSPSGDPGASGMTIDVSLYVE